VTYLLLLNLNSNKVKNHSLLNLVLSITMKKVFIMAAFVAATFSVKAQTTIPADITALLQKHTCYTCHAAAKKMVGPSWTDVAAKKYDAKKFASLVAKPKPENWPGYTAMAPLPNVPKDDLKKIHGWVSTLAK
jgi:cytochrome c